jgi:hypothetical protein
LDLRSLRRRHLMDSVSTYIRHVLGGAAEPSHPREQSRAFALASEATFELARACR